MRENKTVDRRWANISCHAMVKDVKFEFKRIYIEKCWMNKINKIVASLLIVILAACSGGKLPVDSGNISRDKRDSYSYEVRGKTYHVNNNIDKYSKVGIASWYGPGFHGKKTANGEIYNQDALTAAHKTLPLGSVVKVENLENGKTVTLKINDRGPFKPGRIIDVSHKAAKNLDMLNDGIIKVRVTLLTLPDGTKAKQGSFLFSDNDMEPDDSFDYGRVTEFNPI